MAGSAGGPITGFGFIMRRPGDVGRSALQYGSVYTSLIYTWCLHSEYATIDGQVPRL